MWISIGNKTRSTLHYDAKNNFLCVIKGEKVVTLYSPSETKYLYANPIFCEGSVNHSLIEIDAEDIDKKYPLLRNANPMVYTLTKGDLLFIPEGWWHQGK